MISPLFVVALALRSPEGRFLMAERPSGKHLAGLWEFPGGKVKPGETPEQALVREIDEELGLVIETNALFPITFASYTADDFALFMPLFGCCRWSGQPRPREGQKLQWVTPDQAAELPLPPADRPLVAALQQGYDAFMRKIFEDSTY
jgi:8-oxo-dGTP diphosphatase